MVWGILESKSGLMHIPGTALLAEDESQDITSQNPLKRGTRRHAHLILIPQPSNDVNDPLNWPTWQKDIILCLYCFSTVLCVGGIGPILSSIALVLTKEFNISLTQVSLLTGYDLCATGAAGIFISAAAHKYGKRPTLLFSVTVAFAGTLWGGAAGSYGSLVGARVVQGFGIAMFESVMFSVIGDLYFVHQRGSRMALYTVANSGISNLPALLSGKITETLGWRWVFWLLAIFLGIAWVLVILFGWETAFNRDPVHNTDASSQVDNQRIEEIKGAEPVHDENSEERGAVERTTTTTSKPIPKRSLVQRMAPASGTYCDHSLSYLVIRPLTVLINPAVIWAVITLAFPVLWTVSISFVVAQIFGAPPYLLGTAELGYLSAGPVVGGALGCLFVGAIADPMVGWMAGHNKGVYEPEFRLVMMLGLAFFSTLGYFLFGNLITEGKSPAGMAAIWGVIVVTVQFAAITVGTYMVDAYRDISVEVFIISMIFKNFLFFGFSYFLNDWIAAWGPAKLFDAIGGIQLGLCTLAIPMWVFGKKMRAWWHSLSKLS